MDPMVEVRSRLERWLDKVRGYAGNPPPNESTTCYWIVDPLLEELGYERDEIEPQVGDVARQFPDYTILPRTEHTWYIEAKTWSMRLDDTHAAQALTYANNNGRRFVVLTNGRDWRLYDNDLRGTLPERVVASASIEEKQKLLPLLETLGRQSVASGNLNNYVERHRLRNVLHSSLTDAQSPILKALVRAIAKHYPDLRAPDEKTLRECLSELLGGSVLPPAPMQIQNGGPKTVISGLPTLMDLASGCVVPTGARPLAVVTPDGERYAADSWREVVRQVIEWLARDEELPIPFRGRSRGTHWFLNHGPWHEGGEPMKDSLELSIRGSKVHLDVNRSAVDFSRCLSSLCRAVGVNPSRFAVELAGAGT